MRRLALLIACLWLAIGANPAAAQSARLPPEIEAVRKHLLERDYPELFGDKSYRTRIKNAVLADLDGDGLPEVIALFTPHYRQSATIVIYRLSVTGAVTRVTEGLAPGPLVAVSGAFLDSHTLGQGVDFTAIAKDGRSMREAVLQSIPKTRFGGVIEYKTFFHADNRTGALTYVDMRHVEPFGAKDNCEDFEFSAVDEIAAGPLERDPAKPYLAARVGSELWLYQIAAFLPNGFLQKTLEVKPVPPDFDQLVPGPIDVLRYQTRTGGVRAVP